MDSGGRARGEGTWESLKKGGLLSHRSPKESSQVPEGEYQVTKKRPNPLPAALKGPTANDVEDLSRKTGDISLYKYYAATIGWKISFSLLTTVTIRGLTQYFPREWLAQRVQSKEGLMRDSEIWIKLYTQGDVSGTALFSVVYAILVTSSIVALGLSMWYVPNSHAILRHHH